MREQNFGFILFSNIKTRYQYMTCIYLNPNCSFFFMAIKIFFNKVPYDPSIWPVDALYLCIEKI